VTTIFVTHDQEEALELADRVAILNQGRIEQVGAPDEVRDRPANAFVCGFVGEANCFAGEVSGGRFTAGDIDLPAPGAADGPSLAYVRPYDIVPDGEGFAVGVTRVGIDGAVAHVDLVTGDGQRFEAQLSREQGRTLVVGESTRVLARLAHVFRA